MTEARRVARVAWPTVGAAVRAGFVWLVPLLVFQLALLAATDAPSALWGLVLLPLFFFAFARAGVVIGRRASDRPVSQGVVAGGLLFATWLPLRLLVAIVGNSAHPFGGVGAALGLSVLATMLTAVTTARRERAR